MAKALRAGVPQLQWPVTVASTDAKNVSKLDANANFLTSTDDVLSTRGGTVTGNVAFQGTANTFTQGSINSTAIGPLQLKNIPNVTYTLLADDAGKVLVGPASINGNRTVSLPGAAANIPAGTVVEVVGNNPSPFFTYIQAAAGVSLFYNSAIGGSGDGSLGGGVAARVRLRGPLTSARIVRIDDTTWWVFGDMVPA
jgi:hypothetical protein